jgi:hypothetical protein
MRTQSKAAHLEHQVLKQSVRYLLMVLGTDFTGLAVRAV